MRKKQKENEFGCLFFSPFGKCVVSNPLFLMENFMFIYALLVQWGCGVVGMNLEG